VADNRTTKGYGIKLVTPLAIGVETQWGKIVAVGWIGNERYYWVIDRYECTSMLPAIIVETNDTRTNNDVKK